MRKKLLLAVVIVALLVLAGQALADGPVIWKMHCPAHHDVKLVPASDWGGVHGGVHVLCIMAAESEEVTPVNNR